MSIACLPLITYLERKLYYLTGKALLGSTFPPIYLISSEIAPKECGETNSTLNSQEKRAEWGLLQAEGLRLWILGRHLKVTLFGPSSVKSFLAITA